MHPFVYLWRGGIPVPNN